MALTRKFLSALGIEADKVDEIITAHSETVNGLKEKISANEDAATKLEELQKKYDELKKTSDADTPYKEKYENEHKQFESYKKEQTAKETKEQKKDAFKGLLKEAGVSEKHLDAILRVSDVDSLQFDDDGKVKDSDKTIEAIKKDWSDFIPSKGTKGAETSTPPANNGNEGKSEAAIQARTYYDQYMKSHYGVDTSDKTTGNDNNGGKE